MNFRPIVESIKSKHHSGKCILDKKAFGIMKFGKTRLRMFFMGQSIKNLAFVPVPIYCIADVAKVKNYVGYS